MTVEVFGNLIEPNKLEITAVNYSIPSGKGYIVEEYDENNNSGYFNPETGKMWVEEDFMESVEETPKKTVEEQLEEIKGVLADMIMLQLGGDE